MQVCTRAKETDMPHCDGKIHIEHYTKSLTLVRKVPIRNDENMSEMDVRPKLLDQNS